MPIERAPRSKAPWPPPKSRPAHHKVADGETWESVAAKYNIPVKFLIAHNFRTTNTDVVNWYLRNYVGCIITTPDMKNWVFSSTAYPGRIYLPEETAKAESAPNIVHVPGTTWSRVRTNKGWKWKCNYYFELNYVAIDSLAEYGQPVSPYQRGFDPDYVPDFKNIVVEMPQTQVMTNGYGQTIDANSFAIVRRFLEGAIKIPPRTYTFQDLVDRGFATDKDRRIKDSLYRIVGGLRPGTIGAYDAAYVHGTVGFALMSGTRFIDTATERVVDAEIGALDDNWDFQSFTIPKWVNDTVKSRLGPPHYNLEAPIRIKFTGPGKRSKVSNDKK